MLDQSLLQHRSAKEAWSDANWSEDARTLAERELTQIIRQHLAREAGAADIIRQLSYKIDQDLEIATRSRDYAGRLKLLVMRISVLLPGGAGPAVSNMWSPGACSVAIIDSLDRDTAHSVLRQFILHHAPIPSATLVSAGERLRSRGFEKLWQRVARERERIVEWIRDTPECPRNGRGAVMSQEPGEPASSADRAREKDRFYHSSGGLLVDDDDAMALRSPPAHARIFYNPPQIVRWM